MATFPGGVPSLPRPTSTTEMDDTGFEGDLVIDAMSDEIEAIATYLRAQPTNAQTGTTYTIVAADVGKLVTLSNTGAITVTMPTPTSLSIPTGARIDFSTINTGMATFVAGSGATVSGSPSLVTRGNPSGVSAFALSTTQWLLWGDLA